MVNWARTLLLAAVCAAAEDPHLARLRQAAQLQNEGRLSEAVPIYEAVLRQVPSHPDALHLSGLAALAAGDAAKAKELVERASKTRFSAFKYIALSLFGDSGEISDLTRDLKLY